MDIYILSLLHFITQAYVGILGPNVTKKENENLKNHKVKKKIFLSSFLEFKANLYALDKTIFWKILIPLHFEIVNPM